jgi:hypothetical protein
VSLSLSPTRQREALAATPTRLHLTSTPAARVAFALVLAVSLAVRLWGIGWQLPWQFHPDEGHYTWKSLDLMSQDTLNPKYFRNPSLFTYALLGEYRLLGFQPPKADEQAATTDGLLRPPSGVAFVGRVTSALLGVLNVAVVGWMGWRVLGPWTGVLGSLFLGLAFIHVRDSHYATNDVPATCLLTLSVAASLLVLERPRLRSYLLAGLFGGLATSTKYNAGLFVVPLVAAHVVVVWRALSEDGRRFSPLLVKTALVPIVLAGIVSLVAYLAGTPFTILDFPKWLADFRTQASFTADGWEGQMRLPPGLAYLFALGAGLGWIMLGLSVMGLVALARRNLAVATVIAAYPVAYLLFMLRSQLFFVRFALPVVPFLCLLAAVAVVSMASWAGRWRPLLVPVVGIVLAVVALVPTTLDTVHHNLLIAQEDTRVLAARWALANVPAGAKLALEEYTIRDRRPRAYGGPSWQLDTDQLDVNELKRADPTAPLRGTTRFFMVSSFQQERFAGGPDSPQRQFYDALAQQGHVVATFSPGKGNQPIPFDLEDLYSPFWGLDRYERPGPTVTVYEIPGR